MIFNYIKAAKFFPDYAPGVKDWKKKMDFLLRLKVGI